MYKKSFRFLLTLFFLLLTARLLTCPKESLGFALEGLNLWFQKMIPTLLPFMILSGILIRMNLTEGFVRLLDPLLGPLLGVSSNGCYAVLIGFLCGFPMGARVTADLYGVGKISKEEASYLLSFNNNIGPVYFLSFVLPALGVKGKLPYLFGMYGLPFLYGILLRYTVYRKRLPCRAGRKALCVRSSHCHSVCTVRACTWNAHERNARHRSVCDRNVCACNACERSASGVAAQGRNVCMSLGDALDASVMSGLYNIAKLGGYMILFNLLNVLFLSRFFSDSGLACGILGCLLEITGGIGRLFSGPSSSNGAATLTVLLLLPFGGFSCIAQTRSMIQDTDLSMRSYVLHKLALTGLTVVYYALWLMLSPATFPVSVSSGAFFTPTA